MGVGRDLLEQMALAGAARTKLHEIIVALDERDHPKKDDTFCPFAERGRLKPD